MLGLLEQLPMTTDDTIEFSNPVGMLNTLPMSRRVHFGFLAFIAGLSSLFIACAIAYAFLREPGTSIPQRMLVMSFASTVIFFSVFLELVCLRLWFGSRPWLDAAINRIFWRSYAYVFLIPLLFAAICCLFG